MTHRKLALAAGYVGLLLGCTPLRDLDSAVSQGPGDATGGLAGVAGTTLQGGASSSAAGGRAGSGPNSGGRAQGATASGGAPLAAAGGSSSGGEPAAITGGSTAAGAAAEGGSSVVVGTGGDPGSGGAEGGAPASGGTAGGIGSAPPGTGGQGDAGELPLDLRGSPITGSFTVSSEATWEVDGVFEPTFEIHTPTASYWVAKPLGMLVSLVDVDANAANKRQWIDFSSGFRPLRGLPSYGTFGTPERVSTILDVESQTPTHVRLFTASEAGDVRLTWDFYPTHVTLTVNAIPVPYGLAYRGVPAGMLDSADRFVFADGASQSAQLTSSIDDLPGPVEWAYLSDPARGRSLFVIQHADDAIPDRYQVKDNDSAMLSFGDGQLTKLPLRFSFGIVESTEHEVVKERAEFVISAIQ